MKKKILFSSGGTGGHVFPSISLINFFKKKEYETIFVTDKRGAKYVKKNFSLHKIFDVSFPIQAGFANKIFFKFKSRNFTLFYSHHYNIYSNYSNKSTIYSELNINI